MHWPIFCSHFLGGRGGGEGGILDIRCILAILLA